MIITASFSFEAESLAEGEAIVGTWTVTPGVMLNGVQATIVTQRSAGPTEIGSTGNVGIALGARKARAIGSPPLPPPVPGVPLAVPFVQPEEPLT